MKIFKLISSLVILFLMSLSFYSCSSDSGEGSYFGGFSGGSGEASKDYIGGSLDGATMEGTSAPGSGGIDGAEGGSESEGEANGTKRPAGLMTAAAWNDNDYYTDWRALFDQGGEKEGKFYSFHGNKPWGGLMRNTRIKVTVNGSEGALAGAKVVAFDTDGNTVFSAVTDAKGVAYLFTSATEGSIKATLGEAEVTSSFGAESTELTLQLDSASAKRDVIDIMFVIDVTGSMGDELSYLNNELSDVVQRITQSNGDAVINLALLFYRDYGDEEVFAYHDFTNVTTPDGLSAQLAAIDGQQALGGGDYAEAVDDALELAMSKQWSSGASTKLLFHVLDAPPHSADKNANKFENAIKSAAEQGIRICPIICSGADETTEFLMRHAAIYTAGTFIFVTDDSGIGNPHHDPDLPNAIVEALNSLIVRLVNGYHSGDFAPAVSWRSEISDQSKDQQ